MPRRFAARLSRARSSPAGAFLIGAAAASLGFVLGRWAHDGDSRTRWSTLAVLALAVGTASMLGRLWERRYERAAGGPEVLAAVDRAARHGERPADPLLTDAGRKWLRRRTLVRRRLLRWRVVAAVAVTVAALVVAVAADQPLGYGIAAVAGLIAVALPLNERSFTGYLDRADAVLRGGDQRG